MVQLFCEEYVRHVLIDGTESVASIGVALEEHLFRILQFTPQGIVVHEPLAHDELLAGHAFRFLSVMCRSDDDLAALFIE